MALLEATARRTAVEVARNVQNIMGATLTAICAGVKDRKLPYRWQAGSVPSANAELHLRTARDVLRIIVQGSDSEGTARGWMVGLNPRLNDEQPCMALREGRFREVLSAARAFADGTDQ